MADETTHSEQDTAAQTSAEAQNVRKTISTPQKLILRYRYLKELGEGANGKTYLAQNLQTGARVAIKALKLNQNEGFKSFELFKREAETLSSIQVKGVPKFYESVLSEIPGEECYIIQEYVEAPSIQHYLDEGRKFTERETLIIMAKITRILICLQTQYAPPIIHRDIKPSNILCSIPEDTQWRIDEVEPYLIDFGAVANANSNSDKSTIAGTVGYMAPEQNFGECLPQTDFYALGATALHMLTGKPPFEMDFDTYSICFEKYIDELAPKTSSGMRELLKSLLCYAYNKRPESSLAFMQKIIDIASQYHSKRSARNGIAKFNQKIHNLFYRLSDKMVKAPDPNEWINALDPNTDPNCKIANGTVQSIMSDLGLEYTFTVNEKSWAGISKLPVKVVYSNQKLSDYHQIPQMSDFNQNVIDICYPSSVIKPPIDCAILYNEIDPSCNKLYYIRLPLDQKEQNLYTDVTKDEQRTKNQADLYEQFKQVMENVY